ncbi:glycosyltransferase family 2 protein [Aequorivita sediminis]|uniref:glycosyltransferase family 2 protein n=1 Tax=Aequorivita sediminis TaxID=3073653 RepID=UPI0028AFEF91|nr:glycosyltransferase family 2 protein [Aequorivita sp. F6058]
MKQIMFSFIIPVFNAELYIQNCVNSILNQKFNNLELILINDGSTDSSGHICDDYALNDRRIRVFHQENKGQGSARNLGLKHANGTYIIFVDSDDALAKNTLELNYQILEKDTSIECLQFPIFMKYGTEDAYIRKNIEKKYQLESNEFKKLILEDNVISWIVCDKIFKRDSVKSLKFREDIKFEDNFFMMEYVQNIKTFYSSDKGLYYYYFRADSTTTSKLSELKERSTLEVLYLILSFLNPKKECNTFYKFLIRLINVTKSLKVNFGLHYKNANFYSFRKHVNLGSVLKSGLPIKDIIKLILYRIYG